MSAASKTSELLARLKAAGVRVSAEGDELKVSAPKGALTAELRAELGARKAELLAVLRSVGGPTSDAGPISRAPEGERLPLSFTQQRLWFLEQLEPGNTAYNMWLAVVLKGDLDVGALERTVREIVRRHDVLRTTLPDEAGVPYQRVAPAPGEDGGFGLELVTNEDGLPEAEWREEVHRLLQRRTNHVFDLADGPLFLPTLVRIHEREHVLLLLTHHVVFDGLSRAVLARELAALYPAFAAGEPSPLPEPPIQYGDYAAWQRAYFEGPEYERQLAYWREALSGELPVLELPTDRPRPAVQTHDGAIEWFRVPDELVAGIDAVGKREGATLFSALLAVYDLLLSRYTGLEDVLVGTAMGNRSRPELEGLLGYFVNTLVLRTDLSGDPTFRELVRRVRDATLGALEHQDMPFEKLVDELSPERRMGHTPIIQTMFVLDEDTGESRSMGDFELEQYPMESPVARMDLILSVLRDRDGTWVWIEYNTTLFEQETIRRVGGHFLELLASAVAEPEAPISTLSLVPPDERRKLLVERSGPPRAAGEGPVHELFEARADAAPADVALVVPASEDGPDEELTFAELDRRANRLAHHLAAEGVAPGDLVGLCLERSADMVVALLGIVKAGAAYVPLDPGFPPERLAYMVRDAGLRAIVAASAQRALVEPGDETGDESGHGAPRLVLVDAEADAIAARSDSRPAIDVDARERMYVIYTSGSTGTPKGVEIEHRSVTNFLASMAREPGLSAGERLLAVTTLSFDISVLELVLPLVVGGTAIVAPRAVASEGDRLRVLLERLRPDVMQATPATWRTLLLAGWRGDPSLRVLCGGEALSGELADQLLERCGELWNVYGPTEATIWSTVERVREQPVTIGRPIDGTRAYVLDARGDLAPIGVPGELYLAGDGLARGYLARPELTAERFVPDAFAAEAGAADAEGARMYRTGDVARWRADGRLECLGRTDHQVKVRGFRIELGEIDAVLEESPLVHGCATVVREDTPGDRRLVAYFVPEEGEHPGAKELREHAQRRLPSYMIPAAFVELDALPLTPNAKVDRRALLAREAARPTVETAYVAPSSAVEEELARIWAEVLGVERVGVHDSFFELGGNSLLSAQVVARVRASLGVDLPLRLVFDDPTVAALAARVSEAGASQDEPIERIPKGEPAPLSFAQQRLWFLDQLEPDQATYNMWIARRLEGELDADVLERGLAEVVRRHEVLRTRFETRAGAAVPVVDDVEDAFALERVEDPEARPAREWREAVTGRLRELVAEPFDLARGPLLRAYLFRVAPEEHVLLLVTHHIAFDGLSVGVVLGELAELYPAFLAGRPSPLPEPTVQYRDWAAWQRRELSGEALERKLGYWRERLSGELPILELPTDRPRPAEQTYAGAQRRHVLPRELVERLERTSRETGATLFMGLVAAYQALLARYTGQEDAIVGTAVAGRSRPELEGLVGFFANTVSLRVDLSGDPSFAALLGRVREVCVGAFDHQDVPFERLVEELVPERNLATTPIFQTLLTLEEDLGGESRIDGLDVGFVDLDLASARTDLTLLSYLGKDGLTLVAEYNTDLFDAATIDRLLGSLEALVRGATAAPDRALSRLSILSEEERATLACWNDTASAYPHEATIQSEFEARAAETPDAIAALFAPADPRAAPATITYRALNEQANRLAHHLIELGVGPDQLVGLCTERTLPMLVGILGILKAGGAYLPLDPGYPEERLRLMVEDGSCSIVLVQESLRASLPELGGTVIPLDAAEPPFAGASTDDPPVRSGPRDLAYAMFTSGSTGRPKGVCVEQRSVLRLVMDPSFCELGPAETILHFAPISFDASTFEVWGALLRGGRMVVYPPTDPSLEDLGRVLREHRVTTAWLTAGLFSLMVEQRLDDLRGLRQLLAGGDVLPVAQVNRVLRELPDLRFVNGYGPTENTTFACCHQISEGGQVKGSVPIGKPISDTRAYVVDARLQEVPIGVPGQLWLGGHGVARGYLERPELTEERFRPDPFSDEEGARMYSTGDQVRWRPDGTIEFLGRSDDQVKIRGFRIELGEIETVLGELEGVRESSVVVREDVPGDKRIVAYVVGGADGSENGAAELDVAELRAALKERLPGYMVPAHFVRLDALPLSPNGKVDRSRLPAPDASRDVETEYEPPRNEVERVLAEIWEQVLGVERVGVNDNFFDLGGNSLSSTLAMSRIRGVFGDDVPLRWLFADPTIAGLAERVGGDEAKQAAARSYETSFDRCLIPLQPSGWRKPLFLVSGAHAQEEDFLRFVGSILPFMSKEQPIYGFKARGLDGVTPPHASAEGMAADYVRELRELQPSGPYLLAGNCVGGIVAFEMARQLRAAGQEVALLALMDTTAPIDSYRAFVDRHYRFWKLERFVGHLNKLGEMKPGAQVSYLMDRVRKKARRLVPLTDESRRKKHIEDVERNYSQILAHYRPEPYDGKVTLMMNEEFLRSLPDAGWSAWVTGELEVLVVPGDHVTRLSVNARLSAQMLEECISRALTQEAAARGVAG